MTSPSSAPRIPDVVPVLAGEKYSRACGAEARCQSVSAYDGIAIDGVLFTLDEYLAPFRSLCATRDAMPREEGE